MMSVVKGTVTFREENCIDAECQCEMRVDPQTKHMVLSVMADDYRYVVRGRYNGSGYEGCCVKDNVGANWAKLQDCQYMGWWTEGGTEYWMKIELDEDL